jgi:ATP-dependent Clp protease ATP-binding subunit ClpA
MLRRLFKTGNTIDPFTRVTYRILGTPPANKLLRFTQRARNVLNKAQNEAEGNRDEKIRSEHMLLGLLQEKHSVAGKVLRDLLPGLETLEHVVREMATPPESTGKALDLTKEVKRILDYSVDEARFMGHPWIGTEHILIAITQQNNTVAYKAMMHLGLTPERVRERTVQMLKELPRTANNRPVAEVNRIPDDVLERFRVRLVINETENPAKEITLPLK